MAGHPVSVILGVAWNFKLDPAHCEPPRLTVSATIAKGALTLARILFGVLYRDECPQQPNIPSYLLGLALSALLLATGVTFPCERRRGEGEPRPRSGCLQATLQCLGALSLIIWVIAGDIWVFSAYQPNYDPAAADGLYCNKTLYTFALWTAVTETLAFGAGLASFCRGLLCCVLVERPRPGHGDFARAV